MQEKCETKPYKIMRLPYDTKFTKSSNILLILFTRLDMVA